MSIAAAPFVRISKIFYNPDPFEFHHVYAAAANKTNKMTDSSSETSSANPLPIRNMAIHNNPALLLPNIFILLFTY
jgi:hypothetical protein